jgi:hypothetical protein
MHRIYLPTLFQSALAIFSFVLLRAPARTANALQLDIHLKLRSSSCLYQTAKIANQNLHLDSSTEAISFEDSLPHVTLYLTDFRNDTILDLIDTLHHLELDHQLVDINNVMVHGAYSMYSIQKTSSMQDLSDSIVRSCRQYMTVNQIVPDWVYDLPEPQRSKKIGYVHEYGSPNVFDEFDPHLTVGYDADSPENDRRVILEQALSNEGGSCQKDKVWDLGVGIVGDWGTVLWDLNDIPLKNWLRMDS